jgi:hypothetical protein
MLGGITILVRVRRSFPRAPLQRVLLVVILALMGVGVGKDIRDLVRIHRSPGPWVARNHWLEVQALTEWVEENTKLSETILLREAVVVACWSGRLTFELNIRAPDLSQEVLAKLSVTRPDYFVIRDDRLDSAALEPAALPRLTQVGRYTIYKPQGQTR